MFLTDFDEPMEKIMPIAGNGFDLEWNASLRGRCSYLCDSFESLALSCPHPARCRARMNRQRGRSSLAADLSRPTNRRVSCRADYPFHRYIGQQCRTHTVDSLKSRFTHLLMIASKASKEGPSHPPSRTRSQSKPKNRVKSTVLRLPPRLGESPTRWRP